MSAVSKITILAIDQFTKTFNKLQSSLKVSAKGMGTTGRQMQMLGAEITAMTVPIALLGKSMVKRVGNIEQFKVSLDTMLGSAEKGSQMLEQFQQFAATTPFSLEGVVETGTQLLAMGAITEENAIPALNALGNAVAGVGGDLTRIAANYGQVATQGKLTGRELMDFARNGIPIYQALAEQMGVTTAEISEMVSTGQVGFKDVEGAFALMSEEGGKFHNLMETQSKTLKGTLSNINDEFTRTSMELLGISTEAETFGQIIEGGAFDLLKQGANKALEAVQGLSKWFNSLTTDQKNFILGVGEAMVVLGPLLIIFGGFLRVLGGLGWILGLLASPLGLAAGALALFFTQTEVGQGVLANIVSSVGDFITKLDELMATHQRIKEATEGSKKATDELAESQNRLNIVNENQTGTLKEAGAVQSEFYGLLIDNQKLATKEAAAWAKGDSEAVEKIQGKREKLASKISDFATTNTKALGSAEHGWSEYSFAVEDAVEGSSSALNKQLKELEKNSIKERQEIYDTKKAFEEKAKVIMKSSEEGQDAVTTATQLMAAAFQSAQGDISGSVATIASDTSSKMQEPALSASTWGSHLLSNFIAGIQANFPALSGAVSTAIGIVNSLKFSTNPLMPTEIYGEHMIQNFADGAIKATPRVQAAMGEVITIVNAFGQEVKVGINDTAAVFEAYATEVDEATLSHEELASAAAKSMAEMTREIDKGVKEASDTIRELREELDGIFGEFKEKDSSSQQKFAEAVVESEQNIANIKEEIRATDDEAKKASLLNELEREEAARQRNLELVKSVENQVTEIKRVNNLTRLEQSVEVFKKEREENQKWLNDRLDSYNQELDQAKSKLPEIEGLWEERKNLLTQYMGEEVGKSDELNGSIERSIFQVRVLMNELAGLDNQTQKMGIDAIQAGASRATRMPGRASGGPVSSNSSYLVGERGPEVFQPNQGGKIVPNGGGANITININGPVSSEAAAEEILDVVVRKLQQHVKVV